MDNNVKNEDKWDFSDYAFTITGIIVFTALVVPEILESAFDIRFLGGSMDNDLARESLTYGWGISLPSIFRLRAISPLLFMLTTTIVFFKEAIDARKDGGYTGSLFRHTFESLLEDSIYMAITTIMLYSAVLVGAMYISWLAGPITWVIFVFIFPLVRKKDDGEAKASMPWLLLSIFAVGIITEAVTGAWVAFPLSWLIICVIKLVSAIREGDRSIDGIFEILYYAFSVILLAGGLVFGFWMASWAAFPIAIFICWVVNKFRRSKSTHN